MLLHFKEETLKSYFEDFTSRACSDEGWNEILAWLRTSIWPKGDVKVDKKSGENDDNLIAFSLRMQGKLLSDFTKLNALGQFHQHFTRSFCANMCLSKKYKPTM